MYLLDVSVLIALIDTSHIHASKAMTWFQANAVKGWATCPITENGALRILGNPKYPGGGPGNPKGAAIALSGMIDSVPGFHFFPDDVSILTALATFQGVKSAHLTDLYLLALAVHHEARFLTLDAQIDPTPVPGGPGALEILA